MLCLKRLILKEPIVWLDIIGLLCNVCGVLVIEQPKFLFPHSFSSSISGSSSFSSSSSFSFSSSSSSSDYFDERSLAVAVSLFGALSAACAFVSVKYIGNSVHPLHLVAYFAMMSTILSTIITFSVETWVLPATVLEGVALGSGLLFSLSPYVSA
jgi:drug/metabolite transporter (DMT)-like permease